MGEMVERKETPPANILEWAISKDATPEALEKLWKLKMEVDANEAKKAYHVAMAEFKKNPPEIDKDKKVAFGNTKYNHASLYNVVQKITTELSKHGLSASWNTKQNGVIVVTCRITHVDGHSEETTLSAPADSSGSKNAIQSIGSTITYLERYTLLAALGLATKEQDDDGSSAGGVISNEQLSLLRDMLVDMGDEGREYEFAVKFGAESLDQLPEKHYKKAVEVLKMRKEKKAVKK